ncbi:MipA/OmpV family protein [Rouxiella badensis]|jgi:outer membrane protein|uniref:MipA/OmpV family protein n=1 Tax=Rouxiella badensis TaxID=1646377 RepID=UPI0003673BA0|nr:MipA/OmpV family protein [Rouxiella badensis]MCC3704834.1 MipA/OmpV family protein [Rouxiella badensis]MCC3721320.1 MipA/OmpV family protein [Rouxiella badensis]MCC3729426.1 MipA/OmpV family protein [Rouxiella badensis]MCC3735848.1 MipA/OmpV family protein [Rouxiella badensis]MCC3761262.1 MipA/OmpV family protein [Rouxiella badensis]
MITRKLLLHITCFLFAGNVTNTLADTNAASQQSLNLGLAMQNSPRYSGSENKHWQFAPVVQARDGAFFFDSQKGVGYDLQSDSGLYLEHTLGYSLGRSDSNSNWRDGSDRLKGMGNINATVNTVVAVGWAVTPWLSLEGKTILPLSDGQGVKYQTSITLLPIQNETNTVAFQGAALFGDSRYMNTFYGVSRDQSFHSGYAQYQANSGFYGVDSTLTWSHQFTPHWSTAASIEYTRLDKHAKDSPIVFKPNQVSSTIAFIYNF